MPLHNYTPTGQKSFEQFVSDCGGVHKASGKLDIPSFFVEQVLRNEPVPDHLLDKIEREVGPIRLVDHSSGLPNVDSLRKRGADLQDAVTNLKKGDLVYFDPPYITTHLNNGFIHYNSKLFHHSDELRLARIAHSLTMKGVSVVVSNAAHPLIRQQYDGPFFKSEIGRHSTIAADVNRRLKIKELVITTFPLHLA